MYAFSLHFTKYSTSLAPVNRFRVIISMPGPFGASTSSAFPGTPFSTFRATFLRPLFGFLARCALHCTVAPGDVALNAASANLSLAPPAAKPYYERLPTL
jgi:hypothetical protein